MIVDPVPFNGCSSFGIVDDLDKCWFWASLSNLCNTEWLSSKLMKQTSLLEYRVRSGWDRRIYSIVGQKQRISIRAAIPPLEEKLFQKEISYRVTLPFYPPRYTAVERVWRGFEMASLVEFHCCWLLTSMVENGSSDGQLPPVQMEYKHGGQSTSWNATVKALHNSSDSHCHSDTRATQNRSMRRERQGDITALDDERK